MLTTPLIAIIETSRGSAAPLNVPRIVCLVLMLRCATNVATSYPSPSRHCFDKHIPWRWWGNMFIPDGRGTCGDYMFSGHTSCMTITALFYQRHVGQVGRCTADRSVALAEHGSSLNTK